MQTKDRQSCPVDGAGSGVEVGGDALESSRARLSPSPWPAGEVGDLALDDGRSARYLAFQAGSACSLRARCKMASQGWIVIVRRGAMSCSSGASGSLRSRS